MENYVECSHHDTDVVQRRHIFDLSCSSAPTPTGASTSCAIFLLFFFVEDSKFRLAVNAAWKHSFPFLTKQMPQMAQMRPALGGRRGGGGISCRSTSFGSYVRRRFSSWCFCTSTTTLRRQALNTHFHSVNTTWGERFLTTKCINKENQRNVALDLNSLEAH